MQALALKEKRTSREIRRCGTSWFGIGGSLAAAGTGVKRRRLSGFGGWLPLGAQHPSVAQVVVPLLLLGWASKSSENTGSLLYSRRRRFARRRRTGNMSKISRRLAGLRHAFAPRPCAYPTDIPQASFDSPTVTRRDVLSTRTSGTRHSPALRTRFHKPRARRVKSRRRSCPPPPARPSPHSTARPGAGF
jgi:hypothetical protein